jgi:ethanolamine utilization microcompartment shell protein EutL
VRGQRSVRQFFGGRNPIGLHVTTIDPDNVRTAFEVVGVAGDARTHALRDAARPRFFVPAEQRGSQATNRTFPIRTARAAAAIAQPIREVVTTVDTALTVSNIASIEELMHR